MVQIVLTRTATRAFPSPQHCLRSRSRPSAACRRASCKVLNSSLFSNPVTRHDAASSTSPKAAWVDASVADVEAEVNLQTLDERSLELLRNGLEQDLQPAATQSPSRKALSVLNEVERRLDADIGTVFATIVAVVGVIVFWRGVWSLLDILIGDSVLGDVGCMVAGLAIIVSIRLSGARLGDFWPPF